MLPTGRNLYTVDPRAIADAHGLGDRQAHRRGGLHPLCTGPWRLAEEHCHRSLGQRHHAHRRRRSRPGYRAPWRQARWDNASARVSGFEILPPASLASARGCHACGSPACSGTSSRPDRFVRRGGARRRALDEDAAKTRSRRRAGSAAMTMRLLRRSARRLWPRHRPHAVVGRPDRAATSSARLPCRQRLRLRRARRGRRRRAGLPQPRRERRRLRSCAGHGEAGHSGLRRLCRS